MSQYNCADSLFLRQHEWPTAVAVLDVLRCYYEDTSCPGNDNACEGEILSLK